MTNALWSENEELRRKLDEAEQLNRALLAGEIDSIVHDDRAVPLLLREAQDKLRASERLLRAVFDGAQDAMLIADDDGRYVDANPAACRQFGLPRAALLGKRVADFAAPGFSADDSWAAFLRDGEARGEFPLLRADGVHRALDFSAVANVLPGLHLSVLRDVTEANEKERELREAQQRLRAVITQTAIALFAVDQDGTCTLYEGHTADLAGLQPRQAVGQSIFALQPGDADAVRSALAGETVHVELNRNGKTLDLTVLPLRDEQGAVVGATGIAIDITARKTAEVTLRASEARFRAMIEKSQDGITLLSAKARTLYQSPAVERLIGYDIEQATQMEWEDFVDESERPQLQVALGQLLERPSATVKLEFKLRRRDGVRRWVELTATNLLHDPDIGAIVSNFRDITDRKTIERERDGFFRMTPELLCIAGLDGRLRTLNPAWASTLGWSTDELTSRPWLDFVHPEDRAATEREGAKLSEGIPTIHFENRYQCKDGSYRRLQWSCAPSVEDGLIYAVARDITEQRAAAERDRLLFNESPIPMWLVDAESLRFLEVNAAAIATYAYTREEFLSMSLLDLLVDESSNDVRRQVKETLDSSVVRSGRHLYRRRDGTVRMVDKTNHRLDVGARRAILSVVLDVTDRTAMEEELRASERRYRRIVDNAAEGIWMYDDLGTTTFMNPRMAEMVGWKLEDAIGEPVSAFIDLSAVEPGKRSFARDRTAIIPEGEFRLKRPDGREAWVSAHSDPLLDETGRFENGLAMLTDVTEQRKSSVALRRSEEQLRHAQKMEAVGRLAGGIAHDFNNILSAVISYSALLMSDLKPGEPMREEIEEIAKAGHRAAELTRQLLMFSRQQVLEPRVLDLNHLLSDLDKMLRRILGADIDLVSLPASDLGSVRADAGSIEQVIMNLVVNARDAMPTGGQLTLETADVILDEKDTRLHYGAKSGPHVMLAISDTGTGMDGATLAKIFEPFFTTKAKGKGTGLGLSTVFGIVQQSGGMISVQSELNKGTTFKIYLPRVDAAPQEKKSPPPLATLRGSETILVVDDDDQVRTVARSILKRNGYTVIEARNAGEALLQSEKYAETIHLLLTDVVMPQMSGPELARRLATSRPAMKVLCMSGYTDDSIVRHGVLDLRVAYIQKPLSPQTLTKRVREVLTRTTNAPRGPDEDDVAGMRVLVVDDDTEMLASMRDLLTDCGAEVYTAPTVAVALEEFPRFRPDVVLSDVAMPGDDGYVLARRIRAFPAEQGGTTPIIALTACYQRDGVERSQLEAFDAYLSKPANFPELLGLIAGYRSRGRDGHRS